MGFSKMLELLQRKEEGKIVLINCGKFYIAKGKDAILLNKLIGLKLSCMEIEVCKVGFPVNSLEKYAGLIEEKSYSYIVYEYSQEENELTILWEYEGENINSIDECSGNCDTCVNRVKTYKRKDKYVQAVLKLYDGRNKGDGE